jgi:hypothetical protein
MKAEASWLQRVLDVEGNALSADDRTVVARHVVDKAPSLSGAALRARTTGAMRQALTTALVAPELDHWAPLFHRVVSEALGGEDDDVIVRFYELATRFAHLPGMLEGKEGFKKVVAMARSAQRVGLSWSAEHAETMTSARLEDYAVLVLLAVDGSAESARAFTAIVRCQAEAARKSGGEIYDLSDVAARILRAMA